MPSRGRTGDSRGLGSNASNAGGTRHRSNAYAGVNGQGPGSGQWRKCSPGYDYIQGKRQSTRMARNTDLVRITRRLGPERNMQAQRRRKRKERLTRRQVKWVSRHDSDLPGDIWGATGYDYKQSSVRAPGIKGAGIDKATPLARCPESSKAKR